jgi:3-phenylpropionate/cinnamic acid dioxygenase small subunit
MTASGADPGVMARVQDLLARYAQSMDDRRLDDCAALFSPDAVLVLNGEEHQGRPAIRTWMEELGKRPPGRHLTVNMVVTESQPGRVTSVADVAFLGRQPGAGWQIVAVGRYTDEIELSEGPPEFLRREINIG